MWRRRRDENEPLPPQATIEQPTDPAASHGDAGTDRTRKHYESEPDADDTHRERSPDRLLNRISGAGH